jgi:hypothetical protein
MKFPCNVYHPREDGDPKVLVAKDQDELDGLLRIGWKLEASKSDE